MNHAKRRRQQKTLIVSPQPEHTQAGQYFPALLQASETLAPGTVAEAIICHDDWCLLLSERGPCNCTPEVRVTELGR